MARKSASQITEKYARRYAAAGPDYEFGVDNPDRDWLEGYTAASDRMKAELTRALNEGKHIAGAQAAGSEKWHGRARSVGARRFVEASEEARRAYGGKAADVIAAGESAKSAARALPDTTYDQRKQRALAAMDAIHEHWESR